MMLDKLGGGPEVKEQFASHTFADQRHGRVGRTRYALSPTTIDKGRSSSDDFSSQECRQKSAVEHVGHHRRTHSEVVL